MVLNNDIFNFLRNIEANNTREWFAENKKWYDKLKADFDSFAAQLIAVTGKIDKDIAYLEPKNCTYRIYRDTRFSSDKTPYKNNMGVFMVKGGKSSGYAGYYLHVQPNASFIAGGVYMPMPDKLKKIRSAIYENPESFLKIIESKSFKKYFPKLDEDLKLKKPPKDFPADFQHIEYLKYKSYTVSKPISDNLITSKVFMDEAHEVFAQLAPFNRFLNEAIDFE